MEEQQLKITTPMMLWFSIVAVPLKQLDKGGRYELCFLTLSLKLAQTRLVLRNRHIIYYYVARNALRVPPKITLQYYKRSRLRLS
jgi:hypothetical protein